MLNSFSKDLICFVSSVLEDNPHEVAIHLVVELNYVLLEILREISMVLAEPGRRVSSSNANRIASTEVHTYLRDCGLGF